MLLYLMSIIIVSGAMVFKTAEFVSRTCNLSPRESNDYERNIPYYMYGIFFCIDIVGYI